MFGWCSYEVTRENHASERRTPHLCPWSSHLAANDSLTPLMHVGIGKTLGFHDLRNSMDVSKASKVKHYMGP